MDNTQLELITKYSIILSIIIMISFVVISTIVCNKMVERNRARLNYARLNQGDIENKKLDEEVKKLFDHINLANKTFKNYDKYNDENNITFYKEKFKNELIMLINSSHVFRAYCKTSDGLKYKELINKLRSTQPTIWWKFTSEFNI